MKRSAWRLAAWMLAFAFAIDTAPSAFAIDASNRYRSPRNPERRIRRSTELIVLHTTEAPARSSLNKVSERGECHFVVTEEGSVYRIVDRDREAFHAGRSMWNGREDVDKFSIGIECVGYHNKPMSSVQLNAIRSVVKELQAMYRIPDERVICHSHVAYGAPNRWHHFKHRGRKRCGMLFAMPSVRARLGLRSKPAYDPDTRARRLRNADEYLSRVLYGNTDTMRGSAAPTATAVARTPTSSNKSRSITSSPYKPQTTASSGKTVSGLGNWIARKQLTITSSQPKNISQLKSGGWKLRGTISKVNTAAKLAGSKWNAPDTYYTIRNKVIPGNQINSAKIERGMGVWTRK